MPAVVRKQTSDILRQALQKLEKTTPITSTGAGSIARALAESVAIELGDLYDLLDFNMNQSVISTATGRSLDLLGDLYNLPRKTLTNLAAIDKSLGSFYFYMNAPYVDPIIIPAGTRIQTDNFSFIGQNFYYVTVGNTTIPAGQTRAYASITPAFAESTMTAAPGTLIIHNYIPPLGVSVFCTNPKTIQAQQGYEDDDSYRLRLSKGIRIASSGTLESIRFAGLAIPGVRDVRIRQAPYGLGSFEMIVIPEDQNNSDAVVSSVFAATNQVRPVGVKMFLRTPALIPVNITASIIVPTDPAASTSLDAASRSRIAVLRYLNSLLPGDTLIYNRLIQSMLDATDLIRDVNISSFNASGVEVLRRNYKPAADEHVVPGIINVSVAQS